jgi:CDP-paratose 2-epimerase
VNIFISGGAGFIGCNLADACIRAGDAVTVYDNLSRRGSEANLHWLRTEHGTGGFNFVQGDLRERADLYDAMRGHRVVYHLAAQTAVTSSVTDPRTDFEVNALGTFNVLEAARQYPEPPIVVFASTNKVYGGMEDAAVVEMPTRYALSEYPNGVSEARTLDFHSPYGCSKGAADQYVRDYARIYGLRTVVFRQSCIYGQHQMGVEDQGWVAWFIIAAITGQPFTIYGDGKQVRDLLHVDDLIRAYQIAVERIDVTAGQVYNLGGGPTNTLSIWAEFGPLLSDILGRTVSPAAFREWRPGDQPVFVADISRARREFGWAPNVGVREGMERLVAWVRANRELFS